MTLRRVPGVARTLEYRRFRLAWHVDRPKPVSLLIRRVPVLSSRVGRRDERIKRHMDVIFQQHGNRVLNVIPCTIDPSAPHCAVVLWIGLGINHIGNRLPGKTENRDSFTRINGNGRPDNRVAIFSLGRSVISTHEICSKNESAQLASLRRFSVLPQATLQPFVKRKEVRAILYCVAAAHRLVRWDRRMPCAHSVALCRRLPNRRS